MSIIRDEDIDRMLPYWKPETDKEYGLVVLTSWEIKRNNFGKENLIFSVVQVGENVYRTPKEFSTGSYSFIKQIWPLIDQAQKEGRDMIYIAIKMTDRKYVVHDMYGQIKQTVTDATKPLYTGVKVPLAALP